MSSVARRKSKGWSTLWIWVVLAFLLLVGAWTALISIASKNAPDSVPLNQSK